jgi:hypothetical protein
MDAVYSSEMLVSTYKFTRRFYPEDPNIDKMICRLFINLATELFAVLSQPFVLNLKYLKPQTWHKNEAYVWKFSRDAEGCTKVGLEPLSNCGCSRLQAYVVSAPQYSRGVGVFSRSGDKIA